MDQLFDDEDERLSWIDEVASNLAHINQAHITSQMNKLRDILSAQGGEKAISPPAPAAAPPTPPVEAPTARWEESTRPLLHTNPYHPGRIVSDKAMFFGRAAERQLLRAHLQQGISSAIVGARRIGKSSLLYYLAHHEAFDPGFAFCFAYLNLHNGRYQSTADLLNDALRQWATLLGQPNPPRIKQSVHFMQMAQALASGGPRLVLALDGFERLLKRPSIINAELLSQWQQASQSGHFLLLVTATKPLAILLPQQDLPASFAALFAQVDLGLLTPDAAAALAEEPLRRLNIPLLPAAAAELLRLGGAHPFYLQMAGHHLVAQLQMGIYQPRQLAQDFLLEAEPYWLRLWEELPPLAQKLLLEPPNPNPPLVIERQYRLLVQQGLWQTITEEAGVKQYRPFSVAFAEWLARRRP